MREASFVSASFSALPFRAETLVVVLSKELSACFPSQVLSLSHSATGTVCDSMPRHTAHGWRGSSVGSTGAGLARKERLRLCTQASGDVGESGRFDDDGCLLCAFRWEGTVPVDWSEAITAESLADASLALLAATAEALSTISERMSSRRDCCMYFKLKEFAVPRVSCHLFRATAW